MSVQKFQYKIKAIEFGLDAKNREPTAFVHGSLTQALVGWPFTLELELGNDGVWQRRIITANSDGPLGQLLNKNEVADKITSHSSNILKTVNMWPDAQEEAGAKMSSNQEVIPANVDDVTIVSFRSGMLGLPSPDWCSMWDKIFSRLEADPFLQVLGFSADQIREALENVSRGFTHDWVKARYKEAGYSGMGDKFEDNTVKGWFPATHLARIAVGAICRDPGLHYLVELGMALGDLEGFDGFARLTAQLARSPGSLHHLCVAAELHRRGLLAGLEPETGSGSDRNDLLISDGEQVLQVEVKEFSSQRPFKQLIGEIDKKVGRLPTQITEPVVFHVAFNDSAGDEANVGEFRKAFLADLDHYKTKIPNKISAIVVTDRFVNSKGGHVRRENLAILTNPDAVIKVDEQVLHRIFQDSELEHFYPHYHVGTGQGFSFG